MRRSVVLLWMTSCALLQPPVNAQVESRTAVISRLTDCIRDVSVEANRCGGQPLEAAVDLYLSGDTALLPTILRAHEIRFSGTGTDPGALYVQIFQHAPAEFLAAASTLSRRDRLSAFSAFADASADLPVDSLARIREALIPRAAQAAIARRLLHEVDVSNAYRLRNYFPHGVFDPDDARRDDFVRRWYSGQLLALEEPALHMQHLPENTSIYRFVWLRSFDEPVSVRLQVDATGRGTATLHVADGAGGYRPGVTVKARQRTVTPRDVRAFLDLLQKADYWTQPSREPPTPGIVHVDGAQWIIEANKAGRYHIVERWSPSDGPFRDAAALLLRIVGYKPAKDTMY